MHVTASLQPAYTSPCCVLLLAVLLPRPAPACKANALLLGSKITQQQQQQSKKGQQQLEVQLSVPLHAKYPEPHAFGVQGWQALSSGECSKAASFSFKQ
jgi:hypothetical protein